MGDYYEMITARHDRELEPCRRCFRMRPCGEYWFGPGSDLCEGCAIEEEEETYGLE